MVVYPSVGPFISRKGIPFGVNIYTLGLYLVCSWAEVQVQLNAFHLNQSDHT